MVPHPNASNPSQSRRGRRATSPRRIPAAGWRDILWRTWLEVGRDRLPDVAGSVTYYTLLAIIPGLGAFISLYGLVADVHTVEAQLVELSAILPASVVNLLGQEVMRLAMGRPAGLTLAFAASTLFSLWSASASIRALCDGLNVAYNETETRSWLHRTALTYGLTVALVLFLALVSVLLVVTPLALGELGLRSALLVAARWLALFGLVVFAFCVAYRVGPSRRLARWRWVLPGGLVAALLWIAGSGGLSWYVNHIAKLDVTYGSLGTVIAFMLWIWFSVLAVLVGAELNAEIEHQTARDSTVGPARPLGMRGAVVADTIGWRHDHPLTRLLRKLGVS